MNEHQEAEQLQSWQKESAQSLFDEWARENRLVQQKVAIVATGAISDANATVYFPPDLVTESNPFKNKTGRTINPGEKVYLILKYKESDQGWIID